MTPWRRRHWIFDLDGTLTHAVHDFGEVRRLLGLPPGADILGTLAGAPPADAPRLRRLLEDWEWAQVERARPADDALRLIEALRRDGRPLGVLTRNTRPIALRTLEVCGLADAFDPAWVLGRDEAPAKPDPGGLRHLLGAWGAVPEDGVFVGDYLYDLQAGRAAGMMTVHVARGVAHAWPEWTDVRVERLDALLPR